MMSNPTRLFQPKGSLKWKIPTVVATTGSREPSMDVIVEPAYFTAETRVRLDKTVAKTVNPIRFSNAPVSEINSIPVVEYEKTENMNTPKSIT